MRGEGWAPDEMERTVDALSAVDLETSRFSEAECALLAYAEALTRDPSSVRAAHVDRLRAAGFDDRMIHDACAIIAYFAFVNRIADGLGVELEAAHRS